MATKKNKICQSCGMPLKQDPQGGGTEANGSKSELYCSYCYQGGKFTAPDFTVKEMQAFCVEKMVEMKMPRLVAKFFVLSLPRLERWKKK